MRTLICHPSCHLNSIYNIPPGVAIINDIAFSDCIYLVSLTIPSSVTSIGEGAFSDCAHLSSVTIPPSVISLGASAFQGCLCLESLTIPSSVRSIANFRFTEGCHSLATIFSSFDCDSFSELFFHLLQVSFD